MEEFTDYFDEEEKAVVDKYQAMLKSGSKGYLDIFEFEIIVDYFIENNELNQAREAVDYGLKIHPASLNLMYKNAQLLVNEGFYYKAISILTAIQRIEAGNGSVAFLLAVAYCSVGEISKSLKYFDEAIRKADSDKEEILINAGTTLEQLGQYEFALRYFENAYFENDQNSIALFEMAFCCEKLDMDIESIDYYKTYLTFDPYSKLAWTNLAAIYYKLERYEESIDAIEFAIAIDPNCSFSNFQKGLCEIFNQQYEKAIESLNYFLKSEPGDAEAHYYIGEANARLGKNKEAIKYFERTVELDQKFSDAYYAQAYLYFDVKKYTDAFHAIKNAIKIEPKESTYWHLSALICRKLGFFEDSEEAFKTGIALENADPQIWIDYSELLKEKKSILKEITVLSQAYEHFSQNAEINYRLAANFALIKNLDTAVFHLNEALKAEPSKLDIFRSIYKDKNTDIDNLIEKYL